MKRIFDCTAVLAALFLFDVLMLLVALLVKLTSPGPVLYWSDRVGRNNPRNAPGKAVLSVEF